MKPIVFIHTNDKQMLAAKVCAYSLQARSKYRDEFEVRLLRLEATPHLYRGREGRRYLWAGRVCIWRNRDLQSFAPLRFMAPQVMGFQGRALLLDPDISRDRRRDELLQRDLNGKAIVCRSRPSGYYISAVMILDCARLKHWDWNRNLDATFISSWTCTNGCVWSVKIPPSSVRSKSDGITSIRSIKAPCCTTPSVAPSRGNRAAGGFRFLVCSALTPIAPVFTRAIYQSASASASLRFGCSPASISRIPIAIRRTSSLRCYVKLLNRAPSAKTSSPRRFAENTSAQTSSRCLVTFSLARGLCATKIPSGA